MFEPSETPRLFSVPLGEDYPASLVHGLLQRTANMPPEALARVEIIVNSRRMQRRVREIFDQGPPRLLPKIKLLTDLGTALSAEMVPNAVPPLRRRLELIQLISALLEQEKGLAPRSSLYDLSDSLARLMDEMHSEGISPDVISSLDISDQSGHWERIKAFLGIVRHYFDVAQSQPDKEARQRLIIEFIIREWSTTPPSHPIILAGSTGSRGATHLLMQAIARLPQGAVVLPGFDTHMPETAWKSLERGPGNLPLEDHPQYRFYRLARALDLSPTEIPTWSARLPSNPERAALVSLALRPAPVTDQWLEDGPKLKDLTLATQDITLLEAESPRQEALAIAMRLRQAAETGQTAALITPDRILTRQVTAALARWGIQPDDSAGTPLQLTPPGRFSRHVADAMRNRLTSDSLVQILKHPLTHSGGERGQHLLFTQSLEKFLRRKGPPFPTAGTLRDWAENDRKETAEPWANWISSLLISAYDPETAPLASHVERHFDLAQRLSQGSVPGTEGVLWETINGRHCFDLISELREEASHGGVLSTSDYIDLFSALLAAEESREQDVAHPNIRIWGTIEARVQGANLLILASLNEGAWPDGVQPDPWLNRALRHRAGLLSPERRIGLSAHDFQQAVCANEVWLTRSKRADGTETVMSRWLNRLQNLLGGLPEETKGEACLKDMRARGRLWLDRVAALEFTPELEKAPRPAPSPPLALRPGHLSVTEIQTLIRDPYAVYAKHVLKLRPLDPLMQQPDYRLRGTVYHDILEAFIKDTLIDPAKLSEGHLRKIADQMFDVLVPWVETRALWAARFHAVVPEFIDGEKARRRRGQPHAECLEIRGRAAIPDLDFVLSCKADRIDLTPTGGLIIYDYKTGDPPSGDQQKHFDKQLLLEAAMASRGAFPSLVTATDVEAAYISLKKGVGEKPANLTEESPDLAWQNLRTLLESFTTLEQGYASRRKAYRTDEFGDYDHLARYGEWDTSDPSVLMKVTPDET